MANGFGQAIGGLAQGLGSGFLQGANLGLQAQHLKLIQAAQERQDNLTAIKTLGDIATAYQQEPAFGELLLRGAMPLMGIQRGSDQEKDLLGFFKKATDENIQQFKDFTEYLGINGIPARGLGFAMKNPGMLLQIAQLKKRDDFLNQARSYIGGFGPEGGAAIPLTEFPGAEGPTPEGPSLPGPTPALMRSPSATGPLPGGALPAGPMTIEGRVNRLIMGGNLLIGSGDSELRATGEGLLQVARTLQTTPGGIKEAELAKAEAQLKSVLPISDVQKLSGKAFGITGEEAKGIIPISPAEEAEAVTTAQERAKETFRRGQPMPPTIRRLAGGVPIPKTVGEAEDAGISVPPPNDIEKLQNDEAFLRGALGISYKLDTILRESPEAFGPAGAMSSAFAKFKTFTQATLAFLSNDPSHRPFQNGHQKVFELAGITNPRVKALSVGLGYAAATAAGQGGRALSDRDFAFFLQIVGANAPTPEAAVAVMRDFRETLDSQYREKVRSGIGVFPPSFLDPEKEKVGKGQAPAPTLRWTPERGIERIR